MNNDLISREALKKALNANCDTLCPDKNTNWCERCCPHNDFEDLIDNAPTVVAKSCKKLQEIANERPQSEEGAIQYALGYQDGFLDAKKMFERPQGEWVAREDMDYLDENKVVHKHFQCNKCGFIHDFIDGHSSQYNFCPQCGCRLNGEATIDASGADMRKKPFKRPKPHPAEFCDEDCIHCKMIDECEKADGGES